MALFFKKHLELLTGNEDDGDTEDNSYHMRVLRNYYTEVAHRPLPPFIPQDPRAPARAAPAQMVSSSNVPLSSYAPSMQQSDTRSLRSSNGTMNPGRPEVSSSPSFIDSISRGSQPVAAAAPAAPLSQSARLKAQFGKTRSGSPGPSQSGAGGAAAPSLRSSSPYQAPSAARSDHRSVMDANYGRDQYSARHAAAPAAPPTSANAPWAGGGDEYNGFSSYGTSSPFGDSGRAGGGTGRQGMPSGPRSGLVRGPRGMQT